MTTTTTPRSLGTIASEIYADWAPKGKGIYFGAKPYLAAMATLDKVTDPYFADSGPSVVRYFLANATTWKGDKARAIKAELKAMVKGVY